MLLADKHAIIYGAAGAVGGTLARTFAREGATVSLAGRTLAALDVVARDIADAGGTAVTSQVDALQPEAVRAHVDEVVAQVGRIDISVNAIGVDHIQGVPLTDITLDDFMFPLTTYVTSQFLTGTAAARHMTPRRSGTILLISTTAAAVTLPSDGFGVACAAVEALARQLAGELGPHGIRVNCLRPDAIPESAHAGSHTRHVWARAGARAAMTLDDVLDAPGAPGALLQRPLTLTQVADVAAFLVSDRAAAMTATTANVSRGAIID